MSFFLAQLINFTNTVFPNSDRAIQKIEICHDRFQNLCKSKQFFHLKAEISKTNLQQDRALEILKVALETANSSKYYSIRIEGLGLIAEAIGELQPNEKTIELLELVFKSTNEIQESSKVKLSTNKASVMTTIAMAFQNLKQTERATEVIEIAIENLDNISSPDIIARNLKNIVKVLNSLDRVKQATQLLEASIKDVNNIKKLNKKVDSFCYLADAFNEIKQEDRATKMLELALESIDKIPDLHQRETILERVVKYIKKEAPNNKIDVLLQRVLKIINKTQEPSIYDDRYEVILQIIDSIPSIENIDRATQLFKLTIEATNNMVVLSDEEGILTTDYYKNILFGWYLTKYIVEVYQKFNRVDLANQLLELIYKNTKELQGLSRSKALISLAEAFGKIDRLDRSSELFGLALENLKQIKNQGGKYAFQDREYADTWLSIPLKILEIYEKKHQKNSALEILDLTVKETNIIQSRSLKALILTSIAQRYGQLGSIERGDRTIKLALENIKMLEPEEDEKVAIVLSHVAAYFCIISRTEQAIEYFKIALHFGERVNKKHRVEVISNLTELIVVLKQDNKLERANELIQIAISSLTKLTKLAKEQGRLYTLMSIVSKLDQSSMVVNLAEFAFQQFKPSFDDLQDIVLITEELNETNDAVKILELVFNKTNAKKSNDVDDRLETLVSIAKAFAKITKKVDSNNSQARNFVCRFTA